jgi:GAF domain-containing protein
MIRERSAATIRIMETEDRHFLSRIAAWVDDKVSEESGSPSFRSEVLIYSRENLESRDTVILLQFRALSLSLSSLRISTPRIVLTFPSCPECTETVQRETLTSCSRELAENEQEEGVHKRLHGNRES